MKKFFQNKLRYLYTYRMTKLSTVTYQYQTKDWYFEKVPVELIKLWYSKNDISFITLSIKHSSEIECMLTSELIFQIFHEYILITRLKRIFRQF